MVSRRTSVLPLLALWSLIAVAGLPLFHGGLGETEAGLGTMIIWAVSVTAVLLAMTALSGPGGRDVLLLGVAVAVLVAHPALDAALAIDAETPTQAARMVLAAVAAAGAAVAARPRTSLVQQVGAIAGSLAVALIVTGVTLFASPGGHLIMAMALGSSIACLLGGLLAHFVGIRTADRGLVSVGVLTTTAGAARTLWLIAGDTSITIGVFLIAATGVLYAAASALVAFVDSLGRRDRTYASERFARTVELVRLKAQSDRHAELFHDQRSSFLAIEAAARSMVEEHSERLSEAVAIEAARLSRMLVETGDHDGYFDAVATIGPVIDCARPLYGEIRFDHPPEAVVWGNRDAVTEIVRALLDNAYRHGDNPIEVEVGTQADAVSISVHDAGHGVHPSLGEVVFDRGVTTDIESRSGLGLYAARRLARHHGGELVLSPDHRSTFVVTLPGTNPVPGTKPVMPDAIIDLRESDEQLDFRESDEHLQGHG